MRKINFQLKRILSLTICLVMLLTSIAGMTAFADDNNASSGVTLGVNRVADPNTMDDYSDALINDENGTRYAGRIWSDKTVIAHDGSNSPNTLALDKNTDGVNGNISFNEDFLHVFSTLGSSQQVLGVQSSPLDVVLLIDISTSMTTSSSKKIDVAEKAITDANNLIDQFMNGDAEHNVHPANRVGVVVYGGGSQVVMPLDHYEAKSGKNYLTINYGAQANTKWWPTVTTNVTSTTGKAFSNTTSKPMHADSTYLQGALYQGMYMLATESETTYTNPATGKKVDRTPVLTVLTDGGTNVVGATKTIGGSHASNTPINFWNPLSWVSGDKNSAILPVHNSSNATSYEAYIPQPNGNPFYVTVSNTTGVRDAIAPRTVAVLLTAGYMKNWIEDNYNTNRIGDSDIKLRGFGIGLNLSNLSTNEMTQLNVTMNPRVHFVADSRDDQIALAYKNFQTYINNGSPTMTFNNGYKWVISQPLNASWTFNHPNGSSTTATAGNKKYDVTSVDDVYYIEQYFEATSEGLSDVFEQIFENINDEPFIPIGGINDAGGEGSVTYMDPIGQYMEVKDVSNVTLFGNLYGITRRGVYDRNFINAHSKSGSFTSGWYNSSGTKIDSGSWENGDIYYLDEQTAIKHIPTLTDSDSQSQEKLENTVFTCYKFNLSDSELQQKRKNPCFSDDSEVNYTLDDIDIWVENTGHYINDNDLVLQSAFNQSLYINIPVNAMPLEMATIQLDGKANVESYTTNLSNKEQSTPFRVFYTVGMGDDYKTSDGKSVDLSKVTQEYLDKYRSSNGNVHFLSNYFSDTKYSGYLALEPQSQGDPVVSFTSSDDNRYYVFQKSLPLYAHAYTLGDDGTLTRVDPNNGNGNGISEWKAGAAWDGGIFDGEYANLDDARTAAQTGKISKGHVVLIHDEVLDDITHGSGKDFSADDYFFMTVEYYMPTSDGVGKPEERVVARLGSEFSTATIADGIKSSDMLCWYDMSGKYEDIYTYHSYDESGDSTCGRGSIPASKLDGNWVLATKPGGLRVGDMGQDVVSKGGNYNSGTGLYENNKTSTSNNTCISTISRSSSIKDKDDKTTTSITINSYLGNNGRLSVSDTMLFATKTVENRVNGITSLDQEFNFQAYIEGITGTYNAIVVARNANNPNVWQRRISTVDILNNNQNLLLDKNSNLAKYSYNGSEYYIYLHSNEIGDSNSFRAYIADETQKETGESAPKNVKVVNEKTGETKFYSENQVYLIPVSDVDNAGDEGWSFNADSYSENKYKDDFLLCTLDPRQDGSDIEIKSDYATETTYLTKTLTFGLTDDEESYDSSLNNDKARQNTANFTLKDGEGLLFAGIDSGSDYRITEKLTDIVVDEGYSLDNVKHIQQNSSIDYDKDGNITAAERNGIPLDPKNVSTTVDFNEKNHTYSTFGHTSAAEGAVHYTNAYDPVHISISKLLDEADGAKLTEADYNKKFDFSISLTVEKGTKPLAGSFWFELFQDKISDDGTVTESESLGRYPVKLKDGVATFQLQGNQHIFIYGLPVGTEYTSSIHEDDQEGWKPKIVVDGTLSDRTDGEHSGSLSNNDGVLSGNELVFTNVKQPPEPTKVSLNAKKQITGDPYNMKEGEFSFRITPDKNNPKNDPIKEHTAVNDKNGLINLFDNKEYDTVGTYKYTIEELFGNPIPNMEYDKTVYNATVEVFEDQAHDEYRDGYYGKLKAKITIVKENGESSETVESIVFSNAYHVDPNNGQLSVSKTVKNSRGIDNTPFNFTVTFTGTEIDSPTPVVYTDRDGRGTEKSVKLTSTGDKKYTGTFQLKDGETITFTNLPVGTAYTVTESQHSGYFLSDKSGDTGEIKAGTTAKADFINVIALVLPETGGIGVWPFFVTGGFVLLASMLIAYYKYKRKNRFN